MDKKTNRIENNQVTISGEIVSNFEFSHEVMSEGFYIAKLAIERSSGVLDIIPFMASERLIDVKADWIGNFVKISGQFRSYNRHEENKTHLELSVFVSDFELWEDDGSKRPHDENKIFLDGCICKNPTYRETPLGREISDIIIAVNRPYGKSDYIPCIAWGRNARFVDGLEVGTGLIICGRIQSREYQKKISGNKVETRTAYEVSVQKIEVKNDEQGKD